MTNDTRPVTDHDEAGPGPHERRVTFPVSGPVTARLTTRSGDVSANSGDDAMITVTLRASGSAAAHLLEHSDIHYDDATRTLFVVTAGASVDARVGTPFGLGLGRRRSLLGAAMRDVDVTVAVPRSSNLEVKTKSGDCALRGEYEDVDASSVSGDIMVDDAVSAKVRTASGDIMVSRSRTTLSAASASGDINVDDAAGKTKADSASGDVRARMTGEITVATASGDVAVDATGPGRLTVRSVAGDVLVAVRTGLDVDVLAHSVSGSLSSAIPLDGDAAGDSKDLVKVNVSTVSGDVNIVRA
jgi:Putative adhesin